MLICERYKSTNDLEPIERRLSADALMAFDRRRRLAACIPHSRLICLTRVAPGRQAATFQPDEVGESMKTNLRQLLMIGAGSVLLAGCCTAHHVARWE